MTSSPPAILTTESDSPKKISTYDPTSMAVTSRTNEVRAICPASVARTRSDAPGVSERKIGAVPGGLMSGSSAARASITTRTKSLTVSCMPGPSLDGRPRRVGVVEHHLSGERVGIRAEVLLVDDALVVHDEAHHAGDVVLCRPRHQREASRHRVANHVALRPAIRGRALRAENP